MEIYQKNLETLIWKNIWTPIFIAVLFTHQDLEVVQVPISIWVDKKTVHIYTMEYYLAVKKEEILLLQ